MILTTAVQLSSVHGLHGLSIGALAEAVGMTKGGVSAHFKSKTELQLAVVERAAELFYAAVIVPTREQAPGITRLQALSEAWFRYIEGRIFAGGCFFTNATLEFDDLGDSPVAEAIVRQFNRYIAFIERCAEEAVERGELRADTAISAFALEFQGIQLSTLVWRTIRADREPFSIARAAMSRLIQQHAPA